MTENIKCLMLCHTLWRWALDQTRSMQKKTEKQTSASTTMPSVRAPATVSTAPPEIGDTNMAECTNIPFPEVDFDLGFTLTNSQEDAIREFEFEETHHSQESNHNNILGPSNADNTSVAHDSINSVTSDTHARSTTQLTQCSFNRPLLYWTTATWP